MGQVEQGKQSDESPRSRTTNGLDSWTDTWFPIQFYYIHIHMHTVAWHWPTKEMGWEIEEVEEELEEGEGQEVQRQPYEEGKFLLSEFALSFHIVQTVTNLCLWSSRFRRKSVREKEKVGQKVFQKERGQV